MKYINRICKKCGKSFKVKAFRIKHGRGIYCSIPCRRLAQKEAIRGEKNGKWNGGFYIKEADYAGAYKFIRSPNHPYRNGIGYVRQHRLIVEKYIGRYLKPKEQVHHINGDGLDNRIENLQIVIAGEHQRIHHFGRKASIESGLLRSFKMKRIRAERNWYPSEEVKKQISESMKKARKRKSWSTKKREGI